jgi:CheY-like chemotaxis protein
MAKKILLVDDERAILKIVGIKLKLCGYDVVTASHGLEALELIESAKPDLMLLDIIMPVMDGFAVLERLSPAAPMPVIVWSARPESGHKALAMGANAFLSKPFDIDHLMHNVESLIGNRER